MHCYKQLILITLAIISIALSLKVFHHINHINKRDKKNGKTKDNEGLSDDVTIEGTWTKDNQTLLVDNENRSLYQNQSFFDEGHYFSDSSKINFEKQGLKNILYNQNSLTITETFSRNISITSCMDAATQKGTNCSTTAATENISCESTCDGTEPSCIINCNSTMTSNFSVCKKDLMSECYNCNGNFVPTSSLYGIGICNGIQSTGTVIGNWSSTINNGLTTISIRDDNTVLFIMFNGQIDSGTYDSNSSTLILSTQGVKNITYDTSTDTITVSVNMIKSPNNPISTLNGKIFTGWGSSSDELHINYDGTVTALYLGLNGQIFDVYDSLNFRVEYQGQTYRTYRYDPLYNTITDIEDNRVFPRFRPV